MLPAGLGGGEGGPDLAVPATRSGSTIAAKAMELLQLVQARVRHSHGVVSLCVVLPHGLNYVNANTHLPCAMQTSLTHTYTHTHTRTHRHPSRVSRSCLAFVDQAQQFPPLCCSLTSTSLLGTCLRSALLRCPLWVSSWQMMESRAPEERPTTAEATGSSDALPVSVREAYAALPAPRYVAVWILVAGFRKGAFAMHEVECGSDACYCCSCPRYRLTSVMEDKKACVLVPQLVPRCGLTTYLRHTAPSQRHVQCGALCRARYASGCFRCQLH